MPGVVRGRVHPSGPVRLLLGVVVYAADIQGGLFPAGEEPLPEGDDALLERLRARRVVPEGPRGPGGAALAGFAAERLALLGQAHADLPLVLGAAGAPPRA